MPNHFCAVSKLPAAEIPQARERHAQENDNKELTEQCGHAARQVLDFGRSDHSAQDLDRVASRDVLQDAAAGCLLNATQLGQLHKMSIVSATYGDAETPEAPL
ncbi:hypothetical protein EXIGLDRAFT_731251 [Exidia glandulosa HHB12029]|uniref:Uncharacterized protein n=1 Tax=Exidia glandulosa HHB12029 TaxID=1314781 RepID=A0A165L2R4_EXIGL|nr:hypothetical protein EXIGLDRAFT_731251 [Exidia glandulosa HHB12029]